MKPPTPRQIEILMFIAQYMADKERPPTFRDIQANFGFKSSKGAIDAVAVLERKGLITQTSFTARSIRITAAGRVVLREHGVLDGRVYERVDKTYPQQGDQS